MKVEENWVISFHKPTFKKPLRPGLWKVKIVHGDNIVLGQTTFLVVPLAYTKGKAVDLENSVELNNGPAASLYTNDYIIDFDRDANDTESKVKEFSQYSHSTGRVLDSWIDILVARTWEIKSVCAIGDKLSELPDIELCHRTTWSSLSPDPKSNVNNLINKS